MQPPAGPPRPYDSLHHQSTGPAPEQPQTQAQQEQQAQQGLGGAPKGHPQSHLSPHPPPQPYKDDPEDLERFIRQLENVWVLESHKYKKDITKIRYAANLLQKNGTDRHRDRVKWYEPYYPKFDLAAARRLPGGAKATLDPVWSTWSVFVESLRASFATKVGREQVVNQWQELKHTDLIDDFLDSLTNLMWRTGYSEEVAKDKMVRGLNKEIELLWAQTPQKPRSLHKQMALHRDIGHRLENFPVLNKQTNDPKYKKQNGYQNKGNNNNTGGGQRGKQHGQGQISTDRKHCAVELKGIPEDIIAEHKKADMCLKCWKGPYKWFEYYAKNLMVSRTVPKKGGVPQVWDTSKKQKTKDIKISAVGMEDEYGGRIIELVTDSEGDYELLK